MRLAAPVHWRGGTLRLPVLPPPRQVRPGIFVVLYAALESLCLAPPPANAQVQPFEPTPAFWSDARIAAVGDHVGIWFDVNEIGPGSTVTYVYQLSAASMHVPGSVLIDGAPVPDAAVEVSHAQLRITWPASSFGSLSIHHDVRAVGSIGEAVHHLGSYALSGFPPASGSSSHPLRTYPTWIEDETAFLLEPALVQDTWIRQDQPIRNFGGSDALALRQDAGQARRILLQFDIAEIAWLPANYEVVRAYLELWPQLLSTGSISASAYRLNQSWVAGNQDGEDCLSGATWNSPNCSAPWSNGSIGEVIGAASADDLSPALVIDIGQQVAKWLATEPNQGLTVVGNPTGGSSSFVSREGAWAYRLAPRLAVVVAPAGAYDLDCATAAWAEIVPSTVLPAIPMQRLTYSLKPLFAPDDSGVNRLRVSIPTTFGVAAIESLYVGGLAYDEAQTAGSLNTHEYENWGNGTQIDVRFAPALAPTNGDTRVRLVFTAPTPSAADPIGRNFPAAFDHDRRGQPAQSAVEGNANDDAGPGDSDTWRVRTLDQAILGVAIAPPDTFVTLGLTMQYTAWAGLTDSTAIDVTAACTWTIAPDSLGTFSAPGLLQTLEPGFGNVVATFQDTASPAAALRVDPPQPLQVWIQRGAVMPLGASQQLEARGLFSNGDTLTVTSDSQWTVSDTLIARLEAPGLVRAAGEGDTSVLVVLQSLVSDPASISVTPAELVALQVSPAETTLALGYSVHMHAWGTYTDNTTADLTGIVRWEAQPTNIVDVGADGLASTLNLGRTDITATLNTVTSPNAPFTVAPAALVGLDGSPDVVTLGVGGTQGLQSLATYSDGTTSDESVNATWTSLDPTVADFTAPGALLATGVGTTQLVHMLGGVTGDTLVAHVSAATLDNITVTPCPSELPLGADFALAATGVMSDASEVDLTAQATWASSDSTVITVSPTGLLHAWAAGAANITATLDTVTSAPCAVSITASGLDSLIIEPASTTVALGQTRDLHAWGHLNGNAYELTSSVSWSVTDTLVASIDSTGMLLTRSQGSTQVLAQFAATAARPADLQVDAPIVVGLEVQPAATTVRLGLSKQFAATAFLSDDTTLEVTTGATWATTDPSTAYMEANGVALALGLGVTQITATYAGTVSEPAGLTVLPAVEAEALPQGNANTTPGATNVRLAMLRFRNHDLNPHQLNALRLNVSGEVTALRLWLDSGDQAFDPAIDAMLASGTPTTGRWTPTNLGVVLGVGATKAFFVTTDVSVAKARHGAMLDAWVAGEADVFWSTPTALVAPGGYPLNSGGIVTVGDLVLQQIQFTPVPPDTTFAGSTVPVLDLVLPSDGGIADTLTRLEVQGRGSAVAGVDVTALRLQASSSESVIPGPPPSLPAEPSDTWSDVVTLAHTGGGRWVGSGFSVAVPKPGQHVRVLATVAATARSGRSLRFELPAPALQFDSGRKGPIDAGWTSPTSIVIQEQRQLEVTQTAVVPPANPVTRDVGAVPVLGFELVARSANPDTLLQLHLRHTTTGLAGPAADPEAQIQRARLYTDVDASGAVSLGDVLVEERVPGNPDPAGEIVFGASSALDVTLPVGVPIRFLVTLEPDAQWVRDAERLSVSLQQSSDIVTRSGLAVQLPAAIVTQAPPVINGQSATGYDVRAVAPRVLAPGTRNALLLDVVLPANGLEDDVLDAFRVESTGSATTADVAAVRLLQDDGNGVFDENEPTAAQLAPAAGNAWEHSGINMALSAAAPRRFFVVADIAAASQGGRTLAARLPLLGTTVRSGNDGPIDAAIVGGEPMVISASDRVTWIASAIGNRSVPSNAVNQPVLVLEAFNGYKLPRTLNAVHVLVGGTAAAQEYVVWHLFADNGDGQLDENDTQLAVANVDAGGVRFQGFVHTLAVEQQQRLLVSYTLAAASVRDGSLIDAQITTANDFGYQQPTLTAGDFPLDSAGTDVTDGMLLEHITQGADVVPRTLGGGEIDLPTLSLTLPSNGWASDVLESFEVQIAPHPNAAAYGTDITDIELWRETQAAPDGFDPVIDEFLARAIPNAGAFEFNNLSSPIPAGGQHYYVTVDVASAPADSARIQLRVPLNGVQMSSGNDGPLDAPLLGAPVHTVSTSALLASVFVDQALVSRGQDIDLTIHVRNRGSVTLDSISTLQLDVLPSGAAALVSGPTPPFVSLSPEAETALTYRFSMDAVAQVQFAVVVGTRNGSVRSDVATSPIVRVEAPPGTLALQPVSSLPASVNRGQTGVTPLVWQLTHPDSLAASIFVDTVRVHVESSSGAPLPASSVLGALEVRTGGLVHASWTSIPNDTQLTIAFDEPVLLASGEVRQLPLTVQIASGASASNFRLRLAGADAVEARDANSGAPIAVSATLPWNTPPAIILTPATRVDVTTISTLPARVNVGQTNVRGGRISFLLPGAPGESEARITELALDISDAAGTTLAGEALFGRVRVTSGTAALLDATRFETSSGQLRLPLAIPKVLISGNPDTLDVLFDILGATALDSFDVAMADSTEFVVRDANNGQQVAALVQALPWIQGPAMLQQPARVPAVAAESRTPLASSAGAAAVPLAELAISHLDPTGHADVELVSIRMRPVDAAGSAIAGAAFAAARALVDGVPQSAVLVPVGSAMTLVMATPLRILPGTTLRIVVEADLAASLGVEWLRVAIDGTDLELRDGNDPTRTLGTNLLFATELLHIVQQAASVAFGATDDPPANVLRGARTALLPVRILHPGNGTETLITVQRFVLKLQGEGGAALAAQDLLAQAALRAEGIELPGTLSGDSLTFDLSGLAALAPQARYDLVFEADILTATNVADFRLAASTQCLLATAGAAALPISAATERALPYTSPSVHINDSTLDSSFSSYPNPFTPHSGPCRIAFALHANARVTCDVFTLSGERVVRLLNAVPMVAGIHDALGWDGRNGAGDLVRNGTYLLHLRVDGPGGGEAIRKLAVMR